MKHEKTPTPTFKQFHRKSVPNQPAVKSQDALHLQNICYRNTSNHFEEDDFQQPEPFFQSRHKDQSIQPNFHHQSQESEDFRPQPPPTFEYAQSSTHCLNPLQQTNNEIQATPTDFVPPYRTFLSISGDYHKLYSFLKPNKQDSLFIELCLNEKQQKQCESMEHKSQKESAHQLQTEPSANL